MNRAAIDRTTETRSRASRRTQRCVPRMTRLMSIARALIRWMLSLTPSERLRRVQGTIDLMMVERVPNGDR